MKIVRFVFLLVHVGILMLLSAMLLNDYISPKTFSWLNLLSLGFPILMVAYILLTLMWIVLWKKRAIVFLLFGLLFFNATIRWVNYTPASTKTPDLKMMSFNIKGGKYGQDKIQQFVSRNNPDIVLLQECSDVSYFKGFPEKKANAVVSILSKYKIISQKELIENGAGNGDSENAYATQNDIEIKGNIYRIINVHLQSYYFEKENLKLNGNEQEDKVKVKNVLSRLLSTFKIHQEQVELIRKAAERSPYPVIVAGDFNAVPNSYEYYHIADYLKDAFVEAGRGSGTSFHDYKFPIRIDFIFTSKNIEAVSYHVDRSVNLSDHDPVLATFRLNAKNSQN